MKFLLWLILSGLVLLFTPVRAEKTNVVTLSQTLADTLTNNFDILHDHQDLERASGTKWEFRSRDLASAVLESSAGYRKGGLYGKGGPFALFTAQVYQPLFNTGIIPQWRRGQGEVIQAEQRLNLTVSDRLQDVRTLYLRAQRLKQLIALNEELASRLENNIASEKQRQNAGLAGPQFLLQAQVQALSEKGTLTTLYREQSEVQLDWASLASDTLDSLPVPATELTNEDFKVDWKEATKQALARRADLKLLRQLIQNASDDQKVIQSGYFPNISLTASGLYIPGKTLLYQTSQIVAGQTPYGSELRYGVAATWQIINNGQVTGPAREFRAIRQQYEIILKQLEENIPRELARLSHDIEDADAKFLAMKQSVQQADENLHTVESRISLGLATQLDFSDAQRNLLAVRTGLIESLFQRETAIARLDWVSGRYLEFAEPVPRR